MEPLGENRYYFLDDPHTFFLNGSNLIKSTPLRTLTSGIIFENTHIIINYYNTFYSFDGCIHYVLENHPHIWNVFFTTIFVFLNQKRRREIRQQKKGKKEKWSWHLASHPVTSKFDYVTMLSLTLLQFWSHSNQVQHFIYNTKMFLDFINFPNDLYKRNIPHYINFQTHCI